MPATPRTSARSSGGEPTYRSPPTLPRQRGASSSSTDGSAGPSKSPRTSQGGTVSAAGTGSSAAGMLSTLGKSRSSGVEAEGSERMSERMSEKTSGAGGGGAFGAFAKKTTGFSIARCQARVRTRRYLRERSERDRPRCTHLGERAPVRGRAANGRSAAVA